MNTEDRRIKATTLASWQAIDAASPDLNGRIVQGQFLIDVLDWCERIGFPLVPPSAG